MGPLDAFRTLRSAGPALLAQGALHGKLAGLEWQAEKVRLLKMLETLLLGFALGICGLLFAGGLVLLVAWDTPYRATSLAALALLSAFGALQAWRRLHALADIGSEVFADSRAELAADAALLRLSL